MIESLNAFLFSTPERFRYSIYAFYLVGAAILLLAYLVRPYRRTILTFGAVLAIFYTQAFVDVLMPETEPGPIGPMENGMERMRAFIPILLLICTPVALAATFLIDRANVRRAKKPLPPAATNRPWSN